MDKTLYKKTKSGKIQMWDICVKTKGDSGFPEVHITHGLSDGKKQHTYDIIKNGVNIGKKNETTAEQQAILSAERKIKKQKECGYSESLKDTEVDRVIDFITPPKELCFYKPKSKISESKLKGLEQSGRAVYSVKRDGLMHILFYSPDAKKIYSRRMDDVSKKFPYILDQINVDDSFVLLGEIICDVNGADDFNSCCSVCRSDPDVSLEKRNNICGSIVYYVFDIAFYNQKNLLTTIPFSERRNILEGLVKKIGADNIVCSEIIKKSHDDAMNEIKERSLEGLVIWDKDGVMKENECFTYNGKSERPNVLWKSKPIYEDDFIARFNPENKIGEWGTGKNKGKMKSVFLYKIRDGKEIFISKCGGGFTDQDREKYSNPLIFPLVFQVKYDSVVKKTGALRFPVFMRERKDKLIKECE